MKTYAAGELQARHLDLEAPFRLELVPTEESWLCETVLRHLPGKRLVLQLRRGEQCQLGKLFFTDKDLRRELMGYRLLQQYSIPTARLDRTDPLTDGSGHFILYQWLPASTLEDLNAARPLASNSPELLATVSAVADMHRNGLRQIDIHPGNFLCDEPNLWVVDSAAIAAHRKPLRGALARDNLADLLAQFHPGQIDDLVLIWSRYLASWPQPSWRAEALPAAIDRMRALRWRHYRRKLTRACSEFGYSRHCSRLVVWRRERDSAALQLALRDPEALMSQGEALKTGNTATVAKVEIDGRPVIIKRYNIKNWRHRLSRCWRPTRAWHSWHNAHYLLFNGLRTPQPLALIEERQGPLRGRAFFICDFAPGESLQDFLTQAEPAARNTIVDQLASIICRYRGAHISHGDMKADNFIVDAAGVTIIDLDPMKHYRRQAPLLKALRKDIRRLLKNFGGPLKESIAGHLLPQLPEALRR